MAGYGTEVVIGGNVIKQISAKPLFSDILEFRRDGSFFPSHCLTYKRQPKHIIVCISQAPSFTVIMISNIHHWGSIVLAGTTNAVLEGPFSTRVRSPEVHLALSPSSPSLRTVRTVGWSGSYFQSKSHLLFRVSDYATTPRGQIGGPYEIHSQGSQTLGLLSHAGQPLVYASPG